MTILLLGGTGEGRALAQALVERRVDIITSLAGATRARADLPGRVRVGGFGGEEECRKFLRDNSISRIIDATHPFAARISHRTARIAWDTGLPYVQLLRPEWRPGPGDRWTEIDDEAQVADHAQPGQTLFVATGRQTLDRYANLTHCTLIFRQIDPPDAPFPWPNGRYQIGRPPFSVADEVALFGELGVDWLVTKNAGAPMAASKLAAARELGIPVLMIRRPVQPDAPRVETVDQALAWAGIAQ